MTAKSTGPKLLPAIVSVSALDDRGRGLGEFDGKVVVVPRGLPGDTWEVLLKRPRKGVMEARPVHLLHASGSRVEAPCPVVSHCGGCPLQVMAPGARIDWLLARAGRTLASAGLTLPPGGIEAFPCRRSSRFRNKMEFSFGAERYILPDEPQGSPRDFALGLHAAGRFDRVLDLDDCQVAFGGAMDIVARVRAHLRALGVPPRNPKTETGILRYLSLRHGVRTGQTLVNLVTSVACPEVMQSLAIELKSLPAPVHTFVQNVQSRSADTALGGEERVWFGFGSIEEHLLDLRFQISANSFFQTNTEGAESLVGYLREAAGLTGREVVWDLFSGGGVLGLALASRARSVVGFEMVAPACADARRNAAQNGLDRVEVVEGDVLASLRSSEGRPPPDLLIVDPPRAGLHPAAHAPILALPAARMLYVACHLPSAQRFLQDATTAGGYRLSRAALFDLFPHTPHAEVVLVLDHALRGTRCTDTVFASN